MPLALFGIDVGSLAAKVIRAAIKVLFGDLAGSLGDKALRILLVYPDLAKAGQHEQLQTAVAQTLPIALALLGLCTLLGYAHGLATGGPGGAVEAIQRFAFAVIAISAWSWLYGKCIEGANVFFGAMVDLPLVKQSVGQGIELAVAGTATPLGAVVGPIVGILILLLLATKIAATALLSVAYVGGPFALAVFPYPPLSHLTGALFQTLGAVLALPFLWSILLIVFAATGKGALSLDGAGIADDITAPLVTMTLLAMMLLALGFLLKRGHAAGLLPSLRGAQSAGHAMHALSDRVGSTELAARAEAQMRDAAAPPSRPAASAADAVPMGFDATPGPGPGAMVASRSTDGDGVASAGPIGAGSGEPRPVAEAVGSSGTQAGRRAEPSDAAPPMNVGAEPRSESVSVSRSAAQDPVASRSSATGGTPSSMARDDAPPPGGGPGVGAPARPGRPAPAAVPGGPAGRDSGGAGASVPTSSPVGFESAERPGSPAPLAGANAPVEPSPAQPPLEAPDPGPPPALDDVAEREDTA